MRSFRVSFDAASTRFEPPRRRVSSDTLGRKESTHEFYHDWAINWVADPLTGRVVSSLLQLLQEAPTFRSNTGIRTVGRESRAQRYNRLRESGLTQYGLA